MPRLCASAVRMTAKLRNSRSPPVMSELGHSRRGRAASKPGHVRYAAGSGYRERRCVKYIKYMKLHSYKKYPEFIAKPARAREGFLMEIGIHVLHVLHVPPADAAAPESDQSRRQKAACLRSEECGHVEYACIARKENALDCGCKLDKEEIEAGRERCFDCYCIDQD